ncbi:ATP-binding cassette domain-containing protein, partial [Accumulibacter sp.]|uniref:ATP-binding cassette domain-containing protein n=1 Tax=Accumulibacter sp. TaxID=2053492 RepID=UPI002BA8E0D2
SGSGKSTLARCLVGIWPEVQGRVLLDDRPIESLDREELGPFLGYLPQDVELFEGSVAENIARFGEIDSTQVIEAAQRTGIHDMVLRFPRGYDTPMGEAGSFLSGGQRQRIGLARALYGNPSLIVLDEPNANLDDVGEAALIHAILDLKAQGKTVIFISHRMNILAVADRILVLDNGVIQTYGTRQQVMTASQPRTPIQSAGVPTPQPA